MRFFRYLRAQFRALAPAESGAAAVLFGIVVLPMIAIIGAGVDYSVNVREKTRLLAALDAAVLMAATADDVSNANVQGKVASSLKSSLGAPTGGRTLTVTATLHASRSVAATATLTVPTLMLKIFGQPTQSIVANSTAAPSDSQPVEIALVLDTTGSMAGSKITGLQQAARDLTTQMFNTPGGKSGKLRMAMAPFDQYVNVGTGYAGAAWLTNTAPYSDATQSCWDSYPSATYSNPFTVTYACTIDGMPSSCSYTDYATVNLGAPVKICQYNGHAWYGCVGSRAYPKDLAEYADALNPVPALYDTSCNNALQRLTTDPVAFTSKIDNLWVGGETYIAPGLLWGWRLLSPVGPFADGGAYNATKKFLILMTDGFNTHSASYPDHGAFDAADANKVLTETCAGVKATGIKIFTIAFDVTDAGIKSVLQGCANSYSDYYDSSTVADLQTAFKSIGGKITSVRLVQ